MKKKNVVLSLLVTSALSLMLSNNVEAYHTSTEGDKRDIRSFDKKPYEYWLNDEYRQEPRVKVMYSTVYYKLDSGLHVPKLEIDNRIQTFDYIITEVDKNCGCFYGQMTENDKVREDLPNIFFNSDYILEDIQLFDKVRAYFEKGVQDGLVYVEKIQ